MANTLKRKFVIFFLFLVMTIGMGITARADGLTVRMNYLLPDGSHYKTREAEAASNTSITYNNKTYYFRNMPVASSLDSDKEVFLNKGYTLTGWRVTKLTRSSGHGSYVSYVTSSANNNTTAWDNKTTKIYDSTASNPSMSKPSFTSTGHIISLYQQNSSDGVLEYTLEPIYKPASYTQEVDVRYQKVDGSWGDYSPVIHQEYTYGSVVSGTWGGTSEYASKSINYTVTGEHTEYVDVPRNQYHQIIQARYQNADGSWGDYSVVYNSNSYYGATVSWASAATTEYSDVSVSYTVTGEHTEYMNIPRKQYHQVIQARYQNADGSYGAYTTVLEKDYCYGATVSWSRESDAAYAFASVVYTADGIYTKSVDVPRNQYRQVVQVRYQNADGSWGSYSTVLDRDYCYGATVSGSWGGDAIYAAKSVSYTVASARTTSVDVFRKTSESESSGTAVDVPQNANSSIQGTTTTFTKYLTMKSTANVPNSTVTFSVEPGDGVPADSTAKTREVTPGVGTPSISTVTFVPGDTTYSSVQTGDTVELGTGQKYAKKTVTADFTNVTYSKAGIYRYKITETTATGAGVNKSTETRYLDVYVNLDETGNLHISGYAFHPDTDIKINEDDQVYKPKPDGFFNDFVSQDLKLEKQVTGNLGNKFRYYKFTVTLSGSSENTMYNVDLSGADVSGTVSGTQFTNPSLITVGSDGSASVDFYLADNNYVTIQGLAEGVSYNITETLDPDEGYTTTYVDSQNGASSVSSKSDAGIINDVDVNVTFTNYRAQDVPTGVSQRIIPIIYLAAAAALVTVFAGMGKRYRKNNSRL